MVDSREQFASVEGQSPILIEPQLFDVLKHQIALLEDMRHLVLGIHLENMPHIQLLVFAEPLRAWSSFDHWAKKSRSSQPARPAPLDRSGEKGGTESKHPAHGSAFPQCESWIPAGLQCLETSRTPRDAQSGSSAKPSAWEFPRSWPLPRRPNIPNCYRSPDIPQRKRAGD